MTQTAFYILSGKDYIEEARRSAMSVKRHMPHLHTVLFTPDNGVEGGAEFEKVYHLPARMHKEWFLDSTRYLTMALPQLPKRLLWLDSDTYCCMPFGELFDLLDQFDFTGAYAPIRRTGPTVKLLPDCFPELNIGINGIRNNKYMRDFALRWYGAYLNGKAVYGNNDQTSLRDMLWDEKYLRWYVMPPEWNLRLVSSEGYALRDQVRFLHGRARNMEELAQSVNERTGMRIWKPG